MIHKPAYSKQDDAVILDFIAKYPNNIFQATKLAAEEINRSQKGVSQRYYKELRFNNTIIAVASTKGISTLNNQKNAPVTSGIKEDDVLTIILTSLKKLSKKSKLQVVNAILNY